MNWLIIADTENAQSTKEIISKKYKDSIIYECSFSKKDLENLYEVLPSVSSCIVISDSIKNNNSLEFIIGYICGQGINLYTTAKDLPEAVLNFEEINVFESQEALEKFVKSKSKKLLQDELAVDSYNFLYENGMPFDPDNFAFHIEKSHLEIAKCYLNAGMDVNSRDSDGTPMLNVAVRADNFEFVKWLIEQGADLNAVSTDRGYTAIMDAVWRGNKEITQYLIEQGSELNTISKEGQTMLVLAVGGDKKEIVKMLAEKGADPDIPDSMGMSAYGYAQLFKKEEIISILEKFHKE